MRYRFGDFELCLDRRELHGRSGPIHLTPKAFDALVHLVRHRERAVGKEELIEALWRDEAVADGSLTFCIHQVRVALGDRGRKNGRMVTTVPRYGYRFTAAVQESGTPPSTAERSAEVAARPPEGLLPEVSTGRQESGSAQICNPRSAIRNSAAGTACAASPHSRKCSWGDEGEALAGDSPPPFGRATAAQTLLAAIDEDLPFVGRERECERFRRARREAGNGNGQVLLICGEAGVGKTRLLGQFAEEARSCGFRFVAGSCDEMGGALAYRPFADIFRALLHDLPAERQDEIRAAEHGWLGRIVPELGQDTPVLGADLAPARERQIVLEGAARFLARSARDQPLMLGIEDLHWADRSTVLLLREVSRQLSRARLLVVVTRREEEQSDDSIEHVCADIARLPGGHEIVLAGLDSECIGSVLRGIANRPAPRKLTDLLHAETAGNPLFLSELLRLLADRRALFDAAGAWCSSVDLGALDVPRGVRRLVDGRLARLAPATRDLLRTASVLGCRFAYSWLEELAEVDARDVERAMDEAQRCRFVDLAEHGEGIECAFRHEVVWRALYQSMSLPTRRRLHAQAVDTLARRHPTDQNAVIGELAFHCRQAGNAVSAQQAIHYLERAGEIGMQARAYEAAATQLAAAVQRARTGDRRRADLLLRHAQASERAGIWDVAVDSYREAADLCEELGENVLLEDLCGRLARLHGLRQEGEAMLTALQRGLVARPGAVGRERGRLANLMARTMVYARAPDVDSVLDEAERLSRQLGDAALRGEVLTTRGARQWTGTRFTEACTTLEEAARLLCGAGGTEALTICLSDRAVPHGYLGRLDEMERTVRELGDVAERSGDPLAQCLHATFGAVLALVRGDLEEAHDHAEAGARIGRAGARLILPGTLQIHGEIEMARGHPEEALRLLRESVELPGGALAGRYVGPLTLLAARVELGDRAGARSMLRHIPEPPSADEPFSCTEYDALVTATLGLVGLGEGHRARVYVPTLERLASRGVVFSSVSFALLQRVLGMIAAASGDLRQAEVHYETARAQAVALRARSEQAQVAEWHGRALLENGRRRPARSHLEEAEEQYARLGMPLRRERVARLLNGAGASRRTRRRQP